MKLKIIVIVISVGLTFTACSPDRSPTIEAEQKAISRQGSTLVSLAEKAIIDFFYALHKRDYAKAASLYGGTYELLQDYNPILDPKDHRALLQAGCELNGLMCLPVREVLYFQTSSPQVFLFEVKFTNPDGSTFELGPCCGETEETMPPQSTFMISVRCQDDNACHVLDLPPYVP